MKLKNIITLVTTTILTSTICFASPSNIPTPTSDQKTEQSNNTPQTSNSIEIIAPWARPTNPANNNSAVYFEIRNNSDKEVNLINVSSDIANKVELHNSYVDEKGVSKMAKVDKLVIPSKGNIALKPGGMHVMLLDLKDKLEVGKKFDLFLYFDDKTKQNITIEVQKPQ
ncbi:MAG: copper chaperone PCu(A)C [Rickettsia endosymbiont of Bryobia graminum]|nr:copper chaperone PCu(A)C [Rickettsia endosymbiont of Bryobia graminum]